MRIFLSITILILSLQSLAKADDISDFEIEGISIGDTALKILNRSQILEEFKIGKEIAHGVPALWSPNSNCNKPVSITLKSGNFGQADFFKRALQILRGKT